MKIYEALIPSQFFSKLFGATPFTVSKKNVQRWKFSLILPFVHIAIILVLLLQFWSKFVFNVQDIENVLGTASFSMQSFLAVFTVAKDGFWQRRIIDIVRSVNDYDSKSGYDQDSSVKRENKYIMMWGIGFTIVVVAFACLRSIILVNSTPGELYFIIYDEITLLNIDFSLYMFSSLTAILGMRFRHLNSILEKEVRNELQVLRFSVKSKPEKIRDSYTSLVEIGRKLNDHYSSRLFLWTARIMLEVITRTFSATKKKIDSLVVLLLTMRLGSLAVWLFLYTVPCQFVVDQVNKTPRLLMAKNILRPSHAEKNRKEMFTMGMYMVLRPFSFSALGFFTVDVSLARGVFIVIITYTALCIQTR